MSQTAVRVRLAAVAAFYACYAVTAYPWASSNSKSHADIAERAAACVGQPDFTAFAKKNRTRLRAGAVEPDLHKTSRKDLGINKHFFNLLDNQAGQDIEKVRQEFEAVEALIAKGASHSRVAFELGILAHFVSDISQPLHCGGAGTDKNENKYHTRFEHLLDKKPLDTSGCSPQAISGPIDKWQLGNATDSAKHYQAISSDFADNKKLDGTSEALFEQQWRRGVNDVANIFLTIFERHKDYFLVP
jgi:hypothetical protein